MEKKIGLWIDSEKAHVVTFKNSSWNLATITSDIEHFNIHGGSRSATPYGPQDVASDKKILERKKHQQKAFFEKLYQYIEKAEELIIYGPGDIKDKMTKQISDLPTFRDTVMTTETADSITDNQLIALVRNHFEKPS